MAFDLRRIRRLVEQQSAARDRLTSRLTKAVSRLYRPTSSESLYRPEWVEATAARAATLSRAAQVSWGDQAAKYLDLVMAELDGEAGSARQAPAVQLPERLRQVDPVQLWQRPAATYRYEVAQGTPAVQALDRAARRAELLADMDIQLADREAARQVLSGWSGDDDAGGSVDVNAPAVIGYRRIVHPELSVGGVCGLCLAAADRRYSVDDLRAVHERCKCTVLPVTEDDDPGLDLNRQDIRRLYEAAGSTGRQDLAAVRYQVHEHGELGPVLRRADDRFRNENKADEDLDPGRHDIAPWRDNPQSETAPDAAAGGQPPTPPPPPRGGSTAAGESDDYPEMPDGRQVPFRRDAEVTLTEERLRHIFDGDNTGGGHGEEFPWDRGTSVDMIRRAIREAPRPYRARPGDAAIRFEADLGDGVILRVLVDPYYIDGPHVVTAHRISRARARGLDVQ